MPQVETALIIAAGRGSRLDDGSRVPKPLRELCGLTLLRRTILSVARAGVKKVFVVVGYDGEKIISYLDSQPWPVDVQTIENPEWEKSNGISVLAAKGHIQGNFFLLMSDHVFDVNILKSLSVHDPKNDVVMLAVDCNPGRVFDIEDATKVDCHGDRILHIGKNLDSYQVIDTGLFLMTPEFFDVLEELVQHKGDCSLSDGVAGMADVGRAGTFDIGTGYWQDVDTPEAMAHAEKILLNSCRKPTDGFVSRHFNRHVSLFITKYVIRTPVSANVVTLFTTVVGVLSGVYAACGGYWIYLLAAFLFKWASILDGVDGEMSRLRMTDSKFGQWLDTLSDNLTYVLFIVGTVIGVLKRPELNVPGWIPYSALFGLTALLVFMFGYVLLFTNSGSLLAVQSDIVSGEKKSFLQKILSRVYFVIKRDFFATAFLVFAFFDKPHWILLAIAVATNLAWVTLLGNTLRKRMTPNLLK